MIAVAAHLLALKNVDELELLAKALDQVCALSLQGAHALLRLRQTSLLARCTLL